MVNIYIYIYIYIYIRRSQFISLQITKNSYELEAYSTKITFLGNTKVKKKKKKKKTTRNFGCVLVATQDTS